MSVPRDGVPRRLCRPLLPLALLALLSSETGAAESGPWTIPLKRDVVHAKARVKVHVDDALLLVETQTVSEGEAVEVRIRAHGEGTAGGTRYRFSGSGRTTVPKSDTAIDASIAVEVHFDSTEPSDKRKAAFVLVGSLTLEPDGRVLPRIRDFIVPVE